MPTSFIYVISLCYCTVIAQNDLLCADVLLINSLLTSTSFLCCLVEFLISSGHLPSPPHIGTALRARHDNNNKVDGHSVCWHWTNRPTYVSR